MILPDGGHDWAMIRADDALVLDCAWWSRLTTARTS